MSYQPPPPMQQTMPRQQLKTGHIASSCYGTAKAPGTATTGTPPTPLMCETYIALVCRPIRFEPPWGRVCFACRYIGWTDVPLTAKGEVEASQAGAVLQRAGIQPDHVYTSYLKRYVHHDCIYIHASHLRDFITVSNHSCMA
jgi:hypothetical protein